MSKRYTILAIWCLLWIQIIAQNQIPFEWEYYGSLGQVNAFTIKDSTFWIGTDVALVEFLPGMGKQNYYFSNNSPMPVSTISSLFVDPEGDLWIGTFENIYVKSGDQWIIFNSSNAPLQAYDRIICINEDSMGNMWFGKTWGGVLRWNGQNWTQFDNSNSPFQESIIKIVTQPDSTVWFLSYGGHRFFSFNKDSIFNTFVTDSLGMSRILDMAIDSSGTLWLVGDTVYTYNKITQSFEKNYLNVINDTTYRCTSIAFDRYGNAWYWLFGKGLAYFNGNQKILYGYYHNDLQYLEPSGMTADNKGDIWFSFSNELFHFANDTITRMTFFKGFAEGNFTRMIENPDGSYWLMTNNEILSFDGQNSNPVKLDTLRNYFNTTWLYFKDMEIDSKGNKWFLVENQVVKTDGTHWTIFELDSLNLPYNVAYDIEIDSSDIIWTDYGDLLSYDGQSWKRHNLNQTANWSYISNFIKADPTGALWILNQAKLYRYQDSLQLISGYGYPLDMAIDHQGRIWLAPDDAGVDMFDGNNWYNYSPCSEVVAVGASFDTTAWVGCYDGDIFHFKDGEWIAYYMEDETGIWDIPTPNFIFADSRQNIWILYENFGVIRLKETPALSLGNDESQVPSKLTLLQNYPNPFNSQTMFRFYLPKSSFINLELFDILGRKIQTIFSGKLNSGYHTINYNFQELSSGVYFYRLTTGKETRIRKLILLK